MLEGRVAVITGASGQIGAQVARSFAHSGASLVLADVHPRIDQMPANAIYRQTDVTNARAVADLMQTAERELGRLDILVNVAGVLSLGSAAALAEDEWDRVLDINLKGTFLCCQSAIRVMQKNRYGRIINLGSIVGKNGGNARPWLDRAEQTKAANVAYGVSKAGVHIMTVFLAREVAADNITVNAVAPGPIASSMTTDFPEALRTLIPVGRMGQATDVANACLFLASEQSSFITGEILDVNGGMWGD
ncbi:SDR family NAD(P)-dependent oxidoreductase [Bradyrhizobium sp. LHD-71]|uniref:SDR family NAD(P)-dependent oxidoreductase n=1 Tax=Bradyrhizobium sp. LHD-71 TaxID=3072141 RepID=UPI00280E9694|nr:SDR family NAD(P)-dependent oxidoreductase [Bradyrhizobium sp. LHD-71]MDQ8729198.1 SDR family NAD(P)-dependent oxidoreductase [Bradyrhizobium sp. LHD-71]